eukprot:CAMPEP_0171961592 /NCGR_PEP_ID=MMETSP0993-20121228/163657_1 /TAXON_ID=483369 /ORGANISM="non described non described, Strain CCMP2098" /LENGTH=573 /DNA_ID=CAMNT_0012609687 /DNA_START=116 /DNA_END=1834 /DNA_ORIENTATION=-
MRSVAPLASFILLLNLTSAFPCVGRRSMCTSAQVRYLGQRHRLSLRKHPLLLQAETKYADKVDEGEEKTNFSGKPGGSLLAAMLLVAGTTVGGGFLALPSYVAPLGFVSSAALLTAVWLFFVAQSLVVVELLIGTAAELTTESSIASSSSSASEDAVSLVSANDVGMPSVARKALGPLGAVAITLLLVALTQATLVSQISKAGIILGPLARFGCAGKGASWAAGGAAMSTASAGVSGGLASYRAACAVVALGFGFLVFGSTLATRANSLLSAAFGLSAVALFAAGAPIADWSKLGVGGFFSSKSVGVAASSVGALAVPWQASWQAAYQAVPTFLQLLVFGEILPSVCALLRFDVARIRKAVVLGSGISLVLEVGWAALAMGLTPTAPAALASTVDPVSVLLSSASGRSPVAAPLLLLSLSAIATTVIGSYLALASALKDALLNLGLAPSRSSATTTPFSTAAAFNTSTTSCASVENKTSSSLGSRCVCTPLKAARAVAAAARKRAAVSVPLLTLLPPLAIAASSPDLFLAAIDFAGSYPVLLLWGVAPPVMALRLRRKQRTHRDEQKQQLERW